MELCVGNLRLHVDDKENFKHMGVVLVVSDVTVGKTCYGHNNHRAQLQKKTFDIKIPKGTFFEELVVFLDRYEKFSGCIGFLRKGDYSTSIELDMNN